MPEKALIRPSDEFWRIRQWFSIQKEKNACTGRFFAFSAVIIFFFAWWHKNVLRQELPVLRSVCPRPAILQKNPKGSTTISFSLSFLQPSVFHSIDGTFVIAYTKFARNLSGWYVRLSFYRTNEERKIRLMRKPAEKISGFYHRLNAWRSGVFSFWLGLKLDHFSPPAAMQWAASWMRFAWLRNEFACTTSSSNEPSTELRMLQPDCRRQGGG